VLKSIRLATGIRSENTVISSVDKTSANFDNLGVEFQTKKYYSVSRLEFVYDNVLNPAQNIWDGLRYKVFMNYNRQVGEKGAYGPNSFIFGFDARHYYPIFRNFIWAVRAAGDFSWGDQKMIYYLGGADGWMMFGSMKKQRIIKLLTGILIQITSHLLIRIILSKPLL
jgi:hypothetical protein